MRWSIPLILLLALLAGLAWREDFDGDEGFTMRRVEASWRQLYDPFAVHPQGTVDPFDRGYVYDFNPPLYFAAVRLLAGAHPGRLVIRLFSAVALAAALALLAAWARRALGGWGAGTVLLLGATTPALVFFGHEARPYAPPLAVACLALWLAPCLRRRPAAAFVAAALVTVAGCLMHFAFAWWVIGMVVLLRGVPFSREADPAERRAALAGFAGAAAGALAALAVMLPQRHIFKLAQQSISRPVSPELLAMALAQPFCLLGLHPVSLGAGTGLQAGLLGLAAALLPGSRRRRLGFLLLGLWLLPVLLPLGAKLLLPISYQERYSIFGLAGWLLVLGWAAQECRERGGWARGGGAALLIAMLAVNAWWLARNLGGIRPRWRPAIAELKRQARPGDGYSIDPDWLGFAFAANAEAPPDGAVYFNGRFGLPAGAERLWILADGGLQGSLRRRLEEEGWRLEEKRHGGMVLVRANAKGALQRKNN